MAKVLNIHFKQANAAEATLRVTQPKESLDSAAIRAQAQAIIATNVFSPNGSALVSYTGAKLVETTTTDFGA